MIRILRTQAFCLLVFILSATAAGSASAVFECPWTPTSGNNPSADGCYGGGDDGCGAGGGAPPPSGSPPPGSPPTPSTATQAQSCMTYAQSSMTGSDLYATFTSLSDPQRYWFYTTVKGSGGGGNDLQTQVIDNSFGGNMTAYNTWVNLYGPGGALYQPGSFNAATGEFIGSSGTVTGSVSGWSCPSFP